MMGDFRFVWLVLWAVWLTACYPVGTAPVINKDPYREIPDATVVKSGDTIYMISWAYGLNFIDIARWNGIKEPYQLQAGQRLSLRPGAKPKPPVTPVALAPEKQPKSKEDDGGAVPVPIPVPKTTSLSVPKPAATAPKTTGSGSTPTPSPPPPSKSTPKPTPLPKKELPAKPPTVWSWPAKGEIVARYSRDKGVNGIQIAGSPGSPVRSTAGGDVVYVGEGLRGYGKLVIVKHSDTYLSAYAHNRRILVAEGDRIGAGQQIAEMGSTGTDRTMLHFEIRVNGRPQDPLKFLKS